MYITELHLILEVAKSHRGDFRRFKSALTGIQQNGIRGLKVVGLHVCQGEEPSVVPCFGHNSTCDKGCSGTQPLGGVLRYFSVHAWVASPAPIHADIFDTYTLLGGLAELCVCGYSSAVEVL